MVYKDASNQMWIGHGYASGAEFATYTLVNPVTIVKSDYDNLGRKTQDRVTTLGSGVDGTVRRIGVRSPRHARTSDELERRDGGVGEKANSAVHAIRRTGGKVRMCR